MEYYTSGFPVESFKFNILKSENPVGTKVFGDFNPKCFLKKASKFAIIKVYHKQSHEIIFL